MTIMSIRLCDDRLAEKVPPYMVPTGEGSQWTQFFYWFLWVTNSPMSTVIRLTGINPHSNWNALKGTWQNRSRGARNYAMAMAPFVEDVLGIPFGPDRIWELAQTPDTVGNAWRDLAREVQEAK
jgi:hypothetical protein